MSDKIRKYVLPNLPYLFVFWFFSKIGTAYRIAPGTDFGTKLMGMLDTFPKAFETYWPGLGGIDLLVGLAGAAGMYLLIQSKIRQAKKFRRDAEYGTARFGTKEDIKPFVDPKFQNNVILTGTEFLTMNTRPKIPANARNLNACVIGSSGSGKTRFWLTPQLLQAHSSYVVVDPKGGTLDQCGRFLQREKYRVRVFNSIDFSKSMHYNPLAYIKTESDWGRLHQSYLKLHRPMLYNELILSGSLHTVVADLNEQAADRLDLIIRQMMKAEGVTEAMKAENQMLWVQSMNSIRCRAEEIIKTELIYC